MKNRAVYTTLFGDYENLNEVSLPLEPHLDYICFTDDASLKSDTWEIEVVIPAFPADSVRSQRLIKILGHEKLSPYAQTLYIDNSVNLKRPASEFLDYLLNGRSIAIPLHSFRNSVFDEFIEIETHGLDSAERTGEQLAHYQNSFNKTLSETPFWTAIIARENTPLTAEFERIWANHVLRYSRRDQLSIPVAQLLADVEIREVLLDNFESSWHEWPVVSSRSSEIRHYSRSSYDEKFARLEAQNEQLEQKLGEVTFSLTEVQQQVQFMVGS